MSRGLAALVLAAGRAQRFGADKLLQHFRGAPLILHAIAAAAAAPVDRIVVVKRSGRALDQCCCDAAAKDARIALADIESDALSASLRLGLEQVRDAAGVFVFLGDMPLIAHDVALKLADKLGERFAAIPVFEGRQGHPVLLSARAAQLASGLTGDQGAGSLLRSHAHEVARVDVEDEGVTLDVDTVEALTRLEQRGS